MITELFTVPNRRIWPRVSQQVPVNADANAGYTLNVSLRGARIVTRKPLQQHFTLLLELDETLALEAESIWQEELGGHNRVVGVRFHPGPEQEEVLKRWMDRVAC
ncbi:PilZ domain-containing protein [bacterium]|nr:PilZ domain-containing protein [bacterium]